MINNLLHPSLLAVFFSFPIPPSFKSSCFRQILYRELRYDYYSDHEHTQDHCGIGVDVRCVFIFGNLAFCVHLGEGGAGMCWDVVGGRCDGGVTMSVLQWGYEQKG